ncbi:MAG: energy transducer TonB [Gemmatimonadales bacterium]
MLHRLPWVVVAGLLAVAPAAAQVDDTLPRRPFAGEPGCDSPARPASDSVYEADAVDEPVEARRLPIEDMPFRAREVINGRSVFRFIVEPSGRIDRCSIELLEESEPSWTAAVLRQLRHARYQAARRGGQPVRQRVYQLFTYHQDGRLLHGR